MVPLKSMIALSVALASFLPLRSRTQAVGGDGKETREEDTIHAGPKDANRLQALVAGAPEGSTILLEDGTYRMDGGDVAHRLHFARDRVTLRSRSGNPLNVVLDGGHRTGEIVAIDASGVTVADITLRNAWNHLVHVTGRTGSHTRGTVLRNLRLIDPGQQAVKVNTDATLKYYADEGEIDSCVIELTDTGRAKVRDAYTGGIDAHQARGWRIHGNTIIGFWCERGLSEHAIHMWKGCRDTIVEKNTVVNCARGIGFGLGDRTEGRTFDDGTLRGAAFVGHFGGIIRNNVVLADSEALFASQYGFDTGIGLEAARGALVVHNSVVSVRSPASSSIEWRFPATDCTVKNNLATHALLARDGARASLAGNLEKAPLSAFAAVKERDLRLAPGSPALDRGVALEARLCDDDLAGRRRDARPNAGAYEGVSGGKGP